MSRAAVLAAAAVAAAACRGGSPPRTVSATGVVSEAGEAIVRVTTDDGRRLALRMNDDVKVTLAGGEAQRAVITEGAPVRVSYEPQGDGGKLVAVDVEPRGAGAPPRREARSGAPPTPRPAPPQGR